MSDTQTLSSSLFQNLRNTSFEFNCNGETILIHLIKVDTSNMNAEQQRPFSLLFHGPLQPVLKQGLVTLTHQELDELAIFLVANGPNGDAMQYEAVFN